MATKIYTRTGDQGRTSMIGGHKVYKNHLRIKAYGEVDELNSWIGMVSGQIPEDSHSLLGEIQDRLFTIGSLLATDPDKEIKMELPGLRENDIQGLEQEIDRMASLLPPLSSFILPAGTPAVSSCHITRCVCRRAERACVDLQQEGGGVPPLVLAYLNRLSDYLFMLARMICRETGSSEVIWKPRMNKT